MRRPANVGAAAGEAADWERKGIARARVGGILAPRAAAAAGFSRARGTQSYSLRAHPARASRGGGGHRTKSRRDTTDPATIRSPQRVTSRPAWTLSRRARAQPITPSRRTRAGAGRRSRTANRMGKIGGWSNKRARRTGERRQVATDLTTSRRTRAGAGRRSRTANRMGKIGGWSNKRARRTGERRQVATDLTSRRMERVAVLHDTKKAPKRTTGRPEGGYRRAR